ncbi:MAG: hypothetical protein QM770_17940 [Tepidisphaeraceae bacterium]
MKTERIDVHAHLLPALDDGSTCVAESLAIARRYVAAGYTDFHCTPHLWPGYEAYTPTFITERVAHLQLQLDRAEIPLRLHPGAEINLDMPLESMDPSDIPTYGMKRKFALFDFWSNTLPSEYEKRIELLQSMGIQPIRAHPERIGVFQRDPGLLDRLSERGVWFQGNLQCLADPPGRATRDLAERWLREKRYFMLGSDTHGLDSVNIRLQGLANAIEFVGAAEVDRLTKENPRVLLGLDE